MFKKISLVVIPLFYIGAVSIISGIRRDIIKLFPGIYLARL
jgi:hypothetical protein